MQFDHKFDLIKSVLIILMLIIAFSLVLIRAFLGIEITDEVFYISESNHILNGATPFLNNWFQATGASFLTFPFVWIYKLFNSNLEGIFLFYRLSFLLLKLLFCFYIIYLFKNKNKWLFLLLIIPLLVFPYGMIASLNYNSITQIGLLCAGIMLVKRYFLLLSGQKTNITIGIGVIMACVTLCHPDQMINDLLFLAIIIYQNRINSKGKYWADILKYVGSGLAVAILILIYILSKTSIKSFSQSIIMMLKNPYFQLGTDSITTSLKIIYNIFAEQLIFYIISFVLFMMIFFIKYKKIRFSHQFMVCVIIIGLIIGCIYQFFVKQNIELQNSIIILLVEGSLFYSFLNRKNRTWNMIFWCIIVAEILTLATNALTVLGGIGKRFYILYPMGLLTIIYTFYAVKKYHLKTAWGITILLSLFISATQIKSNYTFFYREHGFKDLKYKVESGIYKGCYTTSSKAKSIQNLEIYLRKHVDKNDKILYRDSAPMAYLMTNAKFVTPCTWDITLYTYGFNTDFMLQQYFKLTNHYPTKIIYIASGRDEQLSIDNEDYVFTKYVKQNYLLRDSVLIGDYKGGKLPPEDMGTSFDVRIYEKLTK